MGWVVEGGNDERSRHTILVTVVFVRFGGFVGGGARDEFVGELGFVVRLLVLVVCLLLIRVCGDVHVSHSLLLLLADGMMIHANIHGQEQKEWESVPSPNHPMFADVFG